MLEDLHRRFPNARVIADHVEEDEETSDWITRMEDQAERDIDAERTTVSFRWGRGQVALVKRAAALVGVPYQTYLKLVVFRQATEDLARATRQGATRTGP